MSPRPWLKKMIASIVGVAITNSGGWKHRLLQIDGIKEVTFTHPNDLTTLIRVVTDEGVRYYEIKVTEKI